MAARLLARLLAVGAVTLGSISTAQASCATGGPPPSVQDQVAAARVAFVGQVIYTSDANRSARVHVESIWKGPRLPAYVDVHGEAPGSGPLSGSEGDHTYQAGARYLFLPLNSSPPFEDFGECNSATQEYSGAIAADAPPNAAPPEPATPADLVANVAGQYSWQALSVVALVLVLGGLFLVWRRRRKRL